MKVIPKQVDQFNLEPDYWLGNLLLLPWHFPWKLWKTNGLNEPNEISDNSETNGDIEKKLDLRTPWTLVNVFNQW